MKKKLFLAALVALTLIGCEQKQSEMQLSGDGIKKATITGQVTYPDSEGKMLAKDSVQVRALVANSQYSAGAEGLRQFGPVYTDAKGFYTLEIPVGQNTIAGTQVEVVPFQGEYTDPNSGETITVFYVSGLQPAGALNAGDVKTVNLEAMPELTFKDYQSVVTISGIVTVDAGYQKTSSGYEKAFKPYVNTLKVKGHYFIDGAWKDRDFEDVKTDKDGKYSFDVPAGTTAANVDISTVRFDGTYTKEINGEYVELPVYYNDASINVNFDITNKDERNHDFTVVGYEEAEDLSKNYKINKIVAVVKTLGEVVDEESTADEEVNRYKMGDAFLPFKVRVTLTCPAYDADPANAGSQLIGNEIIFDKVASTTDGKVILENVYVYSAWKNNSSYDICVKVQVADLDQAMPHYYYEFTGFAGAIYHTKTWAEWHKDSDVNEPMSQAFWTRCWPSTKKTQQIEGYYQQTATTTEYIPFATIQHYGEYELSSETVLRFEPREPKTIMGMWNNSAYNTRNKKDENGNYTALTVSDEVTDKDDVKFVDKVTSLYDVRRRHDAYQGACRSYWTSRFPALN